MQIKKQDKTKAVLIGVVPVLVVLIIALIIAATVPLITITYSEPYTDTETYWVTEPYYEREACEKGCSWQLVEPHTFTARTFYNVDCAGDQQYFKITYYKDDVIYATREVYIPVGEQRTVDAGEYNHYCSISVDPPRKPKDCVVYIREVQKTRNVTKLKETSKKVTVLAYLNLL